MPRVFWFPRSLSRAIRVLLACMVLAMLTPAPSAALRAEVSAYAATVKRASQVAARVCSRVANARPYTFPPSYSKRVPASADLRSSAIRVRRTFLLNCSLLC
jgi:hypothetical protein